MGPGHHRYGTAKRIAGNTTENFVGGKVRFTQNQTTLLHYRTQVNLNYHRVNPNAIATSVSSHSTPLAYLVQFTDFRSACPDLVACPVSGGEYGQLRKSCHDFVGDFVRKVPISRSKIFIGVFKPAPGWKRAIVPEVTNKKIVPHTLVFEGAVEARSPLNSATARSSRG